MKKALLVTTVSGFIPQFEMNNVAILKDMGYEIHYATNYNNPSYGKDNSRLDGTGIVRHQIDFARSPYSTRTVTAYRQLKKLMTEINFDLVHCHTPMGGALARLAAKKTNTEPIIYTAHGFHFFKGASIQNVLIYKTMERWLAHYTDVIITINQEDYSAAQKFILKQNSRVYYVPGVGINANKYYDVKISKEDKWKELKIPENTFILLSVGELNKNKNHQIVIRALAECQEKKIIYLICGKGELKEELKKISEKLNVDNQIRFLGFREDIKEIMKISDVFIHCSKREGLPVALMEAMASGLPIICSKIRGNVDLVRNEENGLLYAMNDVLKIKQCIKRLYCDKALREKMEKQNLAKIENFDKKIINKSMKEIYSSLD